MRILAQLIHLFRGKNAENPGHRHDQLGVSDCPIVQIVNELLLQRHTLSYVLMEH